MSLNQKFGLVIHGGVYLDPHDSTQQDALFHQILKNAFNRLEKGDLALDVVCEAITTMEDSGFFIAGKGAGPNEAGYYELDASIMDGANHKAGAVASLRSYKNPILGARAVMEHSPHVMIVAEGAEKFLSDKGLERVDTAYFKPYFDGDYTAKKDAGSHGTVGAAALDRHGNLASGTSTGGLPGKKEGRVGDSPIIGAATYATQNMAVSTTGHGEYFLRNATAHDACVLCEYKGEPLQTALDTVIGKITAQGSFGGIIGINAAAEFAFSVGARGMHRGGINQDDKPFVLSF